MPAKHFSLSAGKKDWNWIFIGHLWSKARRRPVMENNIQKVKKDTRVYLEGRKVSETIRMFIKSPKKLTKTLSDILEF